MQVAHGLRLAAISAAFAWIPAHAANIGQVAASGLTQDQARQVLMLVLRHERYQVGKAGAFVDGDLKDAEGRPPHPGYHDFSVGYDSPKSGATEYWGLFAVSRATGDVWEVNQCKRFAFPELARIQRRISGSTGQTLAGEAPLRRGLGCSDE